MPAAAIGIGAAASLFGAHTQASAAKNAAKTQAQSADRALSMNRDVYNDQMRMMQPYVQFGTQSLANLGQMRDTPFAQQTSGLVNSARYGAPPPQMGPMQGPGYYTGNGGQGVSLGQMGGQQGGGQMVQLRAPTGEVSAVPAHLADQFIQRGAQRIM